MMEKLSKKAQCRGVHWQLLLRILGSLPCAVILLSIAAVLVIVGTWLESTTSSHQYATHAIYSHPAFNVLLLLFFVNIFSATFTRWPFEKKHIPFILTHLGLLLIIGGTVVKNIWGVQGQLRVYEGSMTHELILPGTHALRVERREGAKTTLSLKALPARINDLELAIVEYAPNAEAHYSTWFKKNHLFINGMKPLRAQETAPWKRGALVRVFEEEQLPWEVYAVKTDDLEGAVAEVFMQGADLIVSDADGGKVVFAGPFQSYIPTLDIHTTFKLHPDCEAGECYPMLFAKNSRGEVGIELKGAKALFNQLVEGHPGFSVDIVRQPALLFVQDDKERTHLFAIGTHGEIHYQLFRPDKIGLLAVFDRGHGGYGVQAEIPFGPKQPSRAEKENVREQRTSKKIEEQFQIETMIHPEWLKRDFFSKWEDNLSMISVRVKHEGRSQYISLGYDPTLRGLKWPVLGGDFLMRYQPDTLDIPYAVRLRQARQITYPESQQPYSYESDIEVIDIRTKQKWRVTLSMNEVFETMDGYRFYLSNIHPLDPGKMKEAQITVNRDPAKYWATYPGAFFLAIGIAGLFWWRPHKRLF